MPSSKDVKVNLTASREREFPYLLTLERHEIQHIHDTYMDLERRLGQAMQEAEVPAGQAVLRSLRDDYTVVQAVRFKMQELLSQNKRL